MGRAGGLGRYGLLAFAIAATGGPAAITALYLASTAAVPPADLVAATLVGLVLFAAPLAVWVGYSRAIVSGGGLYAFVERAAGVRAARVQGWIWIVSYLLYLPYTVTYIVYYLLPYVMPLPTAWMRVLEVALPILLCLVIAIGGRAAIYVVGAVGVMQLAAVAALAAVVVRGVGAAHLGSVVHLPSISAWSSVVAGGAGVAFLFVCMSLALFLGDEVTGGGGAMRWALTRAYAIVGASTVVGALAIAAGARSGDLGAVLPGDALASLYASPAAAEALGLLVMASTAALILAEFMGLVRLARAMLGIEPRMSVALISAFFIAADLASLAGPWRFYAVTSAPSLAALYLSQLLVFVVYPRFRRGGGRGALLVWLPAAAAAAWSLYGLVGAVTGSGVL